MLTSRNSARLAVAVVLLLLTTWVVAASNPAAPAALDFAPCEVKGSSGRVNADCATFKQPLDPQRPDGPQIALHVAVIKSLVAKPATDAVTIINGGPGASSLQLYADLAGVFGGLLRDRDVVVLDQRGTGASSPLECPDLDAATALNDPTQAGDTEAEALAKLLEHTSTCLAKLPADPKYFTTSVAVRDLEALRQALGYTQLNLYGVSYGTRVVQHYARRYPKATRALIIDGVLPPNLAMGPMVSRNSQTVLDKIFASCQNQAACQQAFPTLEQDFDELADRLRKRPVPINVADPVTGVPAELLLGYGHLATSIRLMAYAPETVSLIPVLIDQAANHNNLLPIATQALQIQSQLSASMSYGMHNAVVCTEDVPFLATTELSGEQVLDTYLGAEQVQALAAMCEVWPAGVLDQDLREPLVTDIPILVLSGELDPITPPVYGAQVAAKLLRTKHLVAPGQGHGVVARGCIPRLLTEFINGLDLATLDAGCVERLGPEPFFIDLMGPSRAAVQHDNAGTTSRD